MAPGGPENAYLAAALGLALWNLFAFALSGCLLVGAVNHYKQARRQTRAAEERLTRLLLRRK